MSFIAIVEEIMKMLTYRAIKKQFGLLKVY